MIGLMDSIPGSTYLVRIFFKVKFCHFTAKKNHNLNYLEKYRKYAYCKVVVGYNSKIYPIICTMLFIKWEIHSKAVYQFTLCVSPEI